MYRVESDHPTLSSDNITSVQDVDRLVGLVVKASVSREEDPGSIPAFGVHLFPSRVNPVTLIVSLQRLPCQAPGVIGSALGLVGPVSVNCH